MGVPSWKLQQMRRQPLSVITQPPPADLAGLGSQTAALCEISRQVINRLDMLIEAITGSPLRTTDALRAIEAGDPLLMAGIATLTEYFRLSLASVPITHEVLQVAGGGLASITPVIRNSSERTIPMMLTNDDNAQFVRWGADTLTVLNGAILKDSTSEIIRVLPNSIIYAIFPAFSSTVSVSRLGIP